MHFDDSLYHGVIPDVAPGKLCIIWDVHNRHGQFMDRVHEFLNKHPDGQIIQLWDFCGAKESWEYFLRDMISKEIQKKVRILLGNHDDGVPLRDKLSLQDYAESQDGDIISIRGAETPAFARIQWRNHHDEELNDTQFADIMKIIQKRVHQPRVVITHDGPISAVQKMWPERTKEPSKTTRKLQEILEMMQRLPKHPVWTTWIFGHHHEHQEEINGVDFRAIGELETFVI